MNTPKFTRLFVLVGAALLGGACILQTAAPAGTPQVVYVTATPENGAPGDGSGQPSPTFTQELAQVLTATFTPSLTATFTQTPVTMTAGQALSCVKGPDWKLYEWVAGIAKDEAVTVVARAVPEIPDYYVVRKSDGTECWAFSGSSVISGSTASLPIRETPPLPTVNFTVQNHVNIPLCILLIRKAGDAAWGANRFTAPPVFVGGEFVLPITAGYYDVIVRDCAAPATMYEAYNRAIGADANYRILDIAVDVDFSIQNNYPYSVCHVQVQAQVPGASWQEIYNHDTSGSFAVGMTKNFRLRAGAYNLRNIRCTDAVLPIAPLYIRPGMGPVIWS